MTEKYTLALNKAWMPVDIFDIRDTFRLLAKGHAMAVGPDYYLYDFEGWLEYRNVITDMSDESNISTSTVATVNMKIPVPDIIVLIHYTGMPRRTVSFSKENLWIRDAGECVFCGAELTLLEATIDHIHPRSKGGETSFTNCAIACKKCNHSKDDILLEHLSTHNLRFKPKEPITTNPLYKFAGKIKMKDTWKKFLIHS